MDKEQRIKEMKHAESNSIAEELKELELEYDINDFDATMLLAIKVNEVIRCIKNL